MQALGATLALLMGCLGCHTIIQAKGPAKTPKAVYEDAHLYSRQIAIVIGVNSYPGGRSLKHTHTDACRMAYYLQDQGAEVTCCFRNGADGKQDFTQPLVPTAEGLYDLVQRLETGGSRFFFYFAGHSRRVRVTDPSDQKTHTLLLMPQPATYAAQSANRLSHDAPYADVCREARPAGSASDFRGPKRRDVNGEPLTMTPPTVEVAGTVAKILSTRGDEPVSLTQEELAKLGQVTLDISAWFDSGIPLFAPNKAPLSTVVMADGCDLELDSSTRGLSARENPALAETNTLWMTASRGGQATYELESGQGLFTGVLLDGLSGKADNSTHQHHLGLIHAGELESYLNNGVSDLWATQGRSESAPVPTVVFHNPQGPRPGGTTVFVNPMNSGFASNDIQAVRAGSTPYWALGATVAGVLVGLGGLAVYLHQHDRSLDAQRDYNNAALPDERVRRDAEVTGRRADDAARVGVVGGGALLLTAGGLWLFSF